MLMGCQSGANLAAQESSLRIIDSARHFLGSLGPREWEEFDDRRPEGRQLEIKFHAQANAEAATLFIREDDVKGSWPVKLNGKSLGILDHSRTVKTSWPSFRPPHRMTSSSGKCS